MWTTMKPILRSRSEGRTRMKSVGQQGVASWLRNGQPGTSGPRSRLPRGTPSKGVTNHPTLLLIRSHQPHITLKRHDENTNTGKSTIQVTKVSLQQKFLYIFLHSMRGTYKFVKIINITCNVCFYVFFIIIYLITKRFFKNTKTQTS